MKPVIALASVALLSGSVLASDLVVRSEKHTDAVSVAGQERPPEDGVQVLWIGKDRLRLEEGHRVAIVRADLAKMYLLDTQARTCSTVDLPLDLKKHVPAEAAPMIERLMARARVTVTPMAETRKIGNWNATRYTVTMALPTLQTNAAAPDTGAVTSSGFPGGTMTRELWVTKDLGADHAGWQEMYAAAMSTDPFTAALRPR